MIRRERGRFGPARRSSVSPWAIYAVGGYLVLRAVVDVYHVVLPHSLRIRGFTTWPTRAAVLLVATGVLFGYFAIPGLEEPDAVSLFMARTSLLAIPVVVAMAWQRVVATDAPLRSLRGPLARSASPAPPTTAPAMVTEGRQLSPTTSVTMR